MKHSNYITSSILFPTEWIDYELIDFGHGKKLERFGDYTFIRPDSQALAKPVLQKEIWDNADGMFSSSIDEEKGNWKLSKKVPKYWTINYGELKLRAIPTPFRHLGFSLNSQFTGNGAEI